MNATRVRTQAMARLNKRAHPRRLVVLADDGLLEDPWLGDRLLVCRNREEIGRALDDEPRRTLWLSHSVSLTDALLEMLVEGGICLREAGLILLAPPRPASVPVLSALFGKVLGAAPSFRWLPVEELVEVLAAPDEARQHVIGGAVDAEQQSIVLVRGDFSLTLATFSQFEPAGDGTAPEFDNPAFTDYGHTIVLGDYEASVDAILYETDPDYRRALNRKRRREERTLGGSLRRLRKQRGLAQKDFAPLTAKTIARIERNEVETPHRGTMSIIASRLGVKPEEISSF